MQSRISGGKDDSERDMLGGLNRLDDSKRLDSGALEP